jgi:hypothetical protein
MSSTGSRPEARATRRGSTRCCAHLSRRGGGWRDSEAGHWQVDANTNSNRFCLAYSRTIPMPYEHPQFWRIHSSYPDAKIILIRLRKLKSLSPVHEMLNHLKGY